MEKENSYRKLRRLATICEDELISLSSLYGYDIPLLDKRHISYEVNYRAKKRLGQCIHDGLDYHTINISSWLLDNFKDSDIKNTIMHELLHTFEGCNNHGNLWQHYAYIVNKHFKGGYHITRLANVRKMCADNDMDVNTFYNTKSKYEITCKTCGMIFHTCKMSDWTKKCYRNGDCTHKTCGGKTFKVIDLKENKIICDD